MIAYPGDIPTTDTTGAPMALVVNDAYRRIRTFALAEYPGWTSLHFDRMVIEEAEYHAGHRSFFLNVPFRVTATDLIEAAETICVAGGIPSREDFDQQ